MSGSFGYVHSEASDGTWEERHLLNMRETVLFHCSVFAATVLQPHASITHLVIARVAQDVHFCIQVIDRIVCVY